MEPEEIDKPTTYKEKIMYEANHAERETSKFCEGDTATVIRRSHVRVELPAAGLGPRPPSVISSDQEYPSLEHKDIPVPSPYARKLLQAEAKNNESKISGKQEEIEKSRLPVLPTQEIKVTL